LPKGENFSLSKRENERDLIRERGTKVEDSLRGEVDN